MLCSVSTFGTVLLFMIVGLLFVVVALWIGKIYRPSEPNSQQQDAYECGEEPIEGSWGKFNVRFYLIALVFVLFEVEIIFLFPWAKMLEDEVLLTQNSAWKIWAFVEGLVFVLILGLGLAYVWRKGLLSWQRPIHNKTLENTSLIPSEMYEEINERY